MSEEKKNEILGKEKELDESEREAVTGAAYHPCRCIFEGYGEEKHGKSPCYAQGEGKDKSPCACFEAGNSGDWKP